MRWMRRGKRRGRDMCAIRGLAGYFSILLLAANASTPSPEWEIRTGAVILLLIAVAWNWWRVIKLI